MQQMNGKLNVKTINNFDHAPRIPSVDQLLFPRGFLHKLYMQSTFSNIS